MFNAACDDTLNALNNCDGSRDAMCSHSEAIAYSAWHLANLTRRDGKYLRAIINALETGGVDLFQTVHYAPHNRRLIRSASAPLAVTAMLKPTMRDTATLLAQAASSIPQSKMVLLRRNNMPKEMRQALTNKMLRRMGGDAAVAMYELSSDINTTMTLFRPSQQRRIVRRVREINCMMTSRQVEPHVYMLENIVTSAVAMFGSFKMSPRMKLIADLLRVARGDIPSKRVQLEYDSYVRAFNKEYRPK